MQSASISREWRSTLCRFDGGNQSMKFTLLLFVAATAWCQAPLPSPVNVGDGGGSSLCTLSGTQSTGYVLTATDNINGCSWQTVGGSSVDNNTVKNAQYCPDTSITINTITCTTATAFPGAYAAGQAVVIKVANTNTGPTAGVVGGIVNKAFTKN